ncbi:TPA: DUF616 domain-containing protein [Streptococcus suis]|nr:DUF616 domain-containing protein [Streptococcus suis]HEM3659513.1 DUF616 domain-containing protein [Streptococcus suis]
MGNLNHLLIKLNSKKISDKTIELHYSQPISSPFLNERVVVYTSTFGGDFSILEPLFIPDNCDFFYIGDRDITNSSVWKSLEPETVIPNYKSLSNIEKNRFVKMNPHKIFKDYKYSVYIDGNIQLVGDPSEFVNLIGKSGIALHKHRSRISAYDELEIILKLKKININDYDKFCIFLKNSLLPDNFGLAECNVIARDHYNPISTKITEQWWELFYDLKIVRDQISFPIVVYKNDIEMKDITTLGSNVYNNDILRIIVK